RRRSGRARRRGARAAGPGGPGPAPVSGGLGRHLELQRLVLEVLLEPVAPELAAVAGLLVAAEGRERIEGPAVDVDLTGAHAPGDALRALVARGPDGAGEAVGRAVGDAHGVVLVLVGDDREHRAEDLLLADGALGLHPPEHGRLHVVAPVEPGRRFGAAGEELRPFLDALMDVAAHALALRRRGQRAHGGALGHRVAEAEVARVLDRELRRLLVLRLVHQHARVRGAGLPGVQVAVVDH